MSRRNAIFSLIVLVWASVPVRAAGDQRDVWFLGIALDQTGTRGSWARVGQEGKWKDVVAGAIVKERLYTVEKDGRLYVGNLESGERKTVGKAEFGNTRVMFAGGGELYTIETNDCLYRVNPSDGSWSQVGEKGAFKAVSAGTVLKGRLFTLDADGALQATDLSNGKRTQVGKAEFKNVRALFTAGDKLGCIDGDGSLFRIDPEQGKRERIGAEKSWKEARFAGVVKDQLYTTEEDGTLQAASLADGKRSQLAKSDFGNTTFLFSSAKEIYTIETDGSLYVINVVPRTSIDAWDCFPKAFEEVFRDQGKACCRNFTGQNILGNKATHAGILKGIGSLREKATAQDLVVIYMGCHGGVDPEEGWGVDTADSEHLWGHEIKAELAKLPCQVLFFLETCGSGGFAEAHKKDPPVPANVTVLCACSGKQEACNQLDISALEALYGRANANKDGVIDLDELIHYVELRYREFWPEGEKADEHVKPVIVRSKNLAGNTALTKPSKTLAAFAQDGGIYSAWVEKHDGDTYHVHVIGFDNNPGQYFLTSKVKRDAICLPEEGPPLLVEQNKVWYPARILSKQGEKYKVHYLGWQEDEVVTKDRIKYPFVGKAEGK